MFFIAKLVDFFAQPLHWVVGLMVLWLWWHKARPSWARRCAQGALALLLLLGLQPVPDALLARFEAGYAEWPPQADLQGFAGVVVLGGALSPGYISADHRQPETNDAGERMAAAVAIWRRHPGMSIVFTGGEGRYFPAGPNESSRARGYFQAMGMPDGAVQYESESRNTYENAVFTARLPGVDIRRPWLLLTSAWHMPRSMAAFKAAGWNVTAYPVDFRTGASTPWDQYSILLGAEHWYLLLHEWLGLLGYRLSGRL